MALTCANADCGVDFVPAGKNNLYCTKECQRRNKRKRLYWKHPEENRSAALAWYHENRERAHEASRLYWDGLSAERKREIAAKSRRKHLKSKYGLSPGEYEDMYAEQLGCCAICGMKESPLAVDHNHRSGEVRGLLCRKCNLGIGLLDDNSALLARAAQYIEAHA